MVAVDLNARVPPVFSINRFRRPSTTMIVGFSQDLA